MIERFATTMPIGRPEPRPLAKGITSGTVPMGGVVVRKGIYEAFMKGPEHGVELFHGYTYSGHPLAAASIVASIDAMKEEGIVENAKAIGENVLGPGLASLAERHKVIGDVRGGEGLFAVLELVRDTRHRSRRHRP